MKKSLSISLSLVLILMLSLSVLAQEKEEQGNVFAIMTNKVGFDKLDKVLELWEKEWKPLYTQNEYVKSVRVFTHMWGSDWTIVVIAEYESLAALEKAQERQQELSKEKYPDETKRKEIAAKIQSYFTGHFDNIVREVPKLRK
jgi:hypothetical protein